MNVAVLIVLFRTEKLRDKCSPRSDIFYFAREAVSVPRHTVSVTCL